jgi:5-formyltetrahydrofolate cyclo-ligase
LASFAAALDRFPGIVAGYWPIKGELDSRPLLSALAARGRTLALPVVIAEGAPLEFRGWSPGTALIPAGFGTSVPPPGAPILVPGLVLVPLLAFDDALRRLGYGRGYYDITLRALRAAGPVTAIGLAFADQHYASVAPDPWDEPLDAVLTERGWWPHTTPTG